jgi:hypothetical protein
MIARRRFDELCASLQFTRDARSVFVEGKTDARILNRAFMDCGHPEIIAYDIDTIDFAGVQNVPHSNKERCIRVAQALSECRSARGKAVCIVDADHDWYDGCGGNSEFLVRTEHADLTLYFAKESVLKYLTIHILGEGIELDALLTQVYDICTTLFAARKALRELDSSIAFVDDAGTACDIVNSRIVLNVERLIAQILSPANAMKRAHELRGAIDAFVVRTDLDITAQMNGHDFVRVFRYALVKFGRRKFSGSVPEAAVEAMMYAAQAAADLCSSRLLLEVVTRLNSIA